MAHETLSVTRPRWLAVARTAWMVVAAAELVVFAAGVWAYWLQLNAVCADPSRRACNFTQLSPAMRDAVERLGFTVGEYAGYTFAIHAASSLALLAVGVLIFLRKSDGWYGLFVSLLLFTFGTIGPSSVLSVAFEWTYPELAAAVIPLSWFVFPGLGLFLVTFPDGRFVPRWSVVVVVLWILQAVFFGTIDRLPPPLFAAELLIVFGSTLAVQVYRYRRVSDASQRQQTKWVLFGFALGVSTIVVQVLLSVAFPGFGERGTAGQLLEGTWVALLFTPIPLSIGIAVLKYRLWDIDPIINRTLVYGALTVAVVGVYVLVVGYLGAAFRTGGNLAISLVATGLVAVLFQPLRDRLQKGVNRLMYGERDEPYAVVSRLGERLEATLAPDAVLPTIVQTVKEALKLPHAAIALPRGGGFEVVASSGDEPAAADPLVVPLTYGGETVGRLLLAPRVGEGAFSASDHSLLDNLARHAGVAVHGVRVMADLRRSREGLVLAREEERRRLRRDLHDELAPTLAALGLTAATVGELIPTAPEKAASANEKLRASIRATVHDVRRLVYDLRPPALDELGLIGATRERASRLEAEGGLRVAVQAPDELPPLPAAVEVAAYRIAQEAMTNVARHAGAGTCSVRLACQGDRTLTVEVTDDGVGLPEETGGGVGLHSMHERAAELGGEFRIERGSPTGTRVFATLPIGASVKSGEPGDEDPRLRMGAPGPDETQEERRPTNAKT